MENNERKWYQKKRYMLPIGALALIAVIGSNSNPSTPAQVQGTNVTASTVQTKTTPEVVSPSAFNAAVAPSNTQQGTNNNLSNTNSYTNVDGNTVHAPAYSENNQAPDGATAQCKDGSYSFSQNHSGTCSHHGGVSRWLE